MHQYHNNPVVYIVTLLITRPVILLDRGMRTENSLGHVTVRDIPSNWMDFGFGSLTFVIACSFFVGRCTLETSWSTAKTV